MIFIQTDDAVDAMKRIGAELSIEQITQAQSRAINRSLEKARTVSRKEIKKVYNISQKNLKGIDFVRARPTVLTGKLFASRKPLPLDAFAPKQETTGQSVRITRKGAQITKTFKNLKSNPVVGVSIEVKRGEREVLPYAFMIVGGAVRVFARGEYKTGTDHGFVLRHNRVNSSGSDLPIKPLITVSEFGSILNTQVLSRIGMQVKQFYPERLVHEMEYIISKAASRGNGPI